MKSAQLLSQNEVFINQMFFDSNPIITYKDLEYFILPDGRCVSHQKYSGQYRILKCGINNGYHQYHLGGKRYYAHRLVYQTYVGEITEGYEIHHIDHDKGNNLYTNLALVTRSENLMHYYKSKNGYNKAKSNAVKRGKVGSPSGINHGKFKGMYVINGIEYASAHIAAKELGLIARTVLRKCKKNKDGYFFHHI